MRCAPYTEFALVLALGSGCTNAEQIVLVVNGTSSALVNVRVTSDACSCLAEEVEPDHVFACECASSRSSAITVSVETPALSQSCGSTEGGTRGIFLVQVDAEGPHCSGTSLVRGK